MVRTTGPNQMVNRMQGPGKDSQETQFYDVHLKYVISLYAMLHDSDQITLKCFQMVFCHLPYFCCVIMEMLFSNSNTATIELK